MAYTKKNVEMEEAAEKTDAVNVDKEAAAPILILDKDLHGALESRLLDCDVCHAQECKEDYRDQKPFPLQRACFEELTKGERLLML